MTYWPEEKVEQLLKDAHKQANLAAVKFPQPNYVLLKVAEEAGEVVKAGVHLAEGRDTPYHVKQEILQAIAMLIRLYAEGDQVNGVPPIAGDLL